MPISCFWRSWPAVSHSGPSPGSGKVYNLAPLAPPTQPIPDSSSPPGLATTSLPSGLKTSWAEKIAHGTSQTQQEPFPLPHALEKLNLKPEEKEKFRKILQFIATAREKRPSGLYNLNKYVQRLYVALVANLDKILEEHYESPSQARNQLARILGGDESDTRSYVSLYRDPKNSTVANKYRLEGKFPALKEVVGDL